MAGQETKCGELLSRWPFEALLAGNVGALRERDGLTADRVAGAVVPASVEQAAARDGSVSFRFLCEGGRREWLGYCSTPLMAARVQASKIDVGQGNLLLQGIGSGAVAEALLRKMALHQALIILECDPLQVKLAFQLHDFRTELLRGRLVILAGEDFEALLERFYEEHRGYNLIEKSVNQAWLSDQQNQVFAQQITMSMERTASRCLVRIDELSRGLKASQTLIEKELSELFRSGQWSGLRAANCTNVFHITDYCTSRDVLSGFGGLGAETDWQVFDRPDRISAESQLGRLSAFRPHVVVLVNTLRGEFQHLSNVVSSICVTVLRDPPEKWFDRSLNYARLMGEGDFIFASRQEEVHRLAEAGFDSERVFVSGLAVNTELYRPVEAAGDALECFGGEVVMVCDRYSTDPETYNIQLPLHQQLWQAVIEEIRRDPAGYEQRSVSSYLTRAQRCGVRVEEEDVRNHFVRLIENRLGPAVQRDCFAEALKREGFDLRIWGWSDLKRGLTNVVPDYWGESGVSDCVSGAIWPDEQLNRLFNSGSIFVHVGATERAEQTVLDGIAAGAFFLVKSHNRHRREDGLGKLFELNRELITFDNAKDLVRKVRYYLERPEERRRIAAAAREKLMKGHRYADRAGEMLAILKSKH